MNAAGSAAHWRDRRVLVTGATGLLGGWAVESLLDRGADLVCLVRDHTPRARAMGRITDSTTIVHGSLEDFTLLERAMNEYEIQTVLHLAAQTIVGIANTHPLSTFESNIRGTWNLLEACRRAPTVAAVVVASSDKAYGTSPELPYTELFPLRGDHPYDVSKSCADLISMSYFKTYGLPVTITRCGNFFGPGDLNWNRLIPGTARSILRGEPPIIRSDGTFRRDYIYIPDAALAYLQLAEATAVRPEIHGEAFNFSTEHPSSAREIVQNLLDISGRSDLEPVVLGKGENEIQHQFLSAEKARRTLAWSPTYGLLGGLKATFDWYRQHLSDPKRYSGRATARS